MVSAEVAGPAPGHNTPNQPPRASRREGRPNNHGTLFEQQFNHEDLYAVRSAVAAHVAAVTTDSRLVDTMVLIAHELSSNAIRHGGGTGRLRLWIAGSALHCEVTDAGDGLDEPGSAGQSLPPPTLPGGRGLWIARQMSQLRIDTSPAGTTITATLPI
jgi:anti-sigma regulatory factor (Ser/Thr protein kinase)